LLRILKSSGGKAPPAPISTAHGYTTDVVGVSSTEHRSSVAVELDDGWKRSYSGVEPKILPRMRWGWVA